VERPGAEDKHGGAGDGRASATATRLKLAGRRVEAMGTKHRARRVGD
jgi:hypothetical protein